MSDLHNREKTLENKYAKDQELRFRIESRACKLLGLWAAAEMGLEGDAVDSYVGSVITANLAEAGVQDVIGKVTGDLTAAGKTPDALTVETMMVKFLQEAETQLTSVA